MARPARGRELKEHAGKTLRPSEWLTVTQERVNRFADVTGDHYFIHVDEAAAKATPLGSTIAHGFLSLSLLSHLQPPDWPAPESLEAAFNYGFDRVRFLQPVKVGARVRVHTKIVAVDEKRPGEYLVRSEKTMEIEGEEKPAFIAEWLVLLIDGKPRD